MESTPKLVSLNFLTPPPPPPPPPPPDRSRLQYIRPPTMRSRAILPTIVGHVLLKLQMTFLIFKRHFFAFFVWKDYGQRRTSHSIKAGQYLDIIFNLSDIARFGEFRKFQLFYLQLSEFFCSSILFY